MIFVYLFTCLSNKEGELDVVVSFYTKGEKEIVDSHLVVPQERNWGKIFQNAFVNAKIVYSRFFQTCSLNID